MMTEGELTTLSKVTMEKKKDAFLKSGNKNHLDYETTE